MKTRCLICMLLSLGVVFPEAIAESPPPLLELQKRTGQYNVQTPWPEDDSEPAVEAWSQKEKERLTGLIDTLMAIHQHYPDDFAAKLARKLLGDAIQEASYVGGVAAAETATATLLADKSLPVEFAYQLYEARLMQVAGDEPLPVDAGTALAAEFEARYPQSQEAGLFYFNVASELEGHAPEAASPLLEKAAALGEEGLKRHIAGIQERQKLLNSELDLQFTALDGSKVDMKDLRGKVVLIDFWATWCGPCIAELPNVKETYGKYHDKGFEIIGISFDQDEDALKEMIAEEEMPWPQYFDGKGWNNDLGRKYGINSIPEMWLVDKTGKLVNMNARDGLEEKVARLLAG